jgi:DNA repair protein RecN (Recombination protein N)
MLLGLKISNIAVIDEVEVSFGPGLTVLTGETGAGKSILIDSLGLLMGGRASADVVRAGSDEASVEAVFAKTPAIATRLASMGLPDLGDEVSLRRVIGRNTRGRVYVNGALVTVGVLARILRGLVDISGQYDYVSIFDPCVHRALLDRAGRTEALLEAYHRDLAALEEIDRRIAELGDGDPKAEQKLEFLRFQLDELERIGLKLGEEAELDAERRRLSAVEKLRAAATAAESLLSAQDGSSLETIDRASSALSDAADVDPMLGEIATSLRTARVELEEAARRLSGYLRRLESDPRRLAELEDRLDCLRRIGRKHGCAVEDLGMRKADIEAELGKWENRQAVMEELRPARERAEAAARASANKLSSERSQAAAPLSDKVRNALSQLAVDKALFEVRLAQAGQLGPDGVDQVEFLFSANPGEPPRPLSRVASGGESSRLLLALKRALCSADECCCYVLDEADAGVGGAVAEVVARMLREISLHRQVLFITHLPQVAAYADHHLRIEKGERDGRSASKVVRLQTPAARTEELARMLSGLQVTSEARGAAEALVRSARRSQVVSTARATRAH